MFGRKKLQATIDAQRNTIKKLLEEIDTLKSKHSVSDYMMRSTYEDRIQDLEDEVKVLRGDIDSLNIRIEKMQKIHERAKKGFEEKGNV